MEKAYGFEPLSKKGTSPSIPLLRLFPSFDPLFLCLFLKTVTVIVIFLCRAYTHEQAFMIRRMRSVYLCFCVCCDDDETNVHDETNVLCVCVCYDDDADRKARGS